MKYSSYVKARKLSLDEVLPHINQDVRIQHQSLYLWCPDIDKHITVHVTSARMRLIGRTQECAACKVKGDHFWAEANSKFPNGKPCGWHLNLYAFNYHGDPVMMTLDHIRPRTKGGTKASNNIQLLCNRCNSIKQDEKMSLLEIVKIRATGDQKLREALEEAGVI